MKKIIIIFLFMAGIAFPLSAQNEKNTSNVPYEIGERWFASKDYRNAVYFFSKAIERNYIPAYFKRGLALYKLGRYEHAIKDFDKCIENNYMVSEARSKRELAISEQKKTGNTETKTDVGGGVNSEYMAKQFYTEGVNLYAKGDFQKALSFFDSAIKMNPSSADAYTFKALINSHLENFEEVVKACNRAMNLKDNLIDGKLSDIYFNRGVAYISMKKYEDAKNDLDEAIKLNPKEGNYYTVRGALKHNIFDDEKGACEDWNSASKNGDYSGAAKYLEKYCK